MRLELTQFYCSGGAASQSFTIPWDKAYLAGIDFAVTTIPTATADSAILYLSLTADAASYQLGVQNKMIAGVRSFYRELTAAGMQNFAMNKYVRLPDPGIAMPKASQIWCIQAINGGITFLGNVFLHFRVG